MSAAPRTIAAAEVSAKNQPMNARESSIVLGARRYRRKDALQDRDGGRRAAGNRDVDRDDVRDPAAARVALAEDSPRAPAVADRDHQLRVGGGLPGAPERGFHIPRHGTGYEQHVGVARARHELDAQALKVVVGAVHRVDLELAAVARAGIHVPDRQRAAEALEDDPPEPLLERSQRRVRKRSGLGDDAGLRYLLQQ